MDILCIPNLCKLFNLYLFFFHSITNLSFWLLQNKELLAGKIFKIINQSVLYEFPKSLVLYLTDGTGSGLYSTTSLTGQ